MGSDIVAKLADALQAEEPRLGSMRLAAVSVILKDRESPSTLLIKRAERPGDPWSGQIAFPGGKMQPEDRTARDTAVRETKEEVGLDLNGTSEFLGYAGPTRTHTGSMDVVPAVFLLEKEVGLKPNPEVASHRWVKLQELLSPRARTTYRLQFRGETVEMPAIVVQSYLVWGLTHRIITGLLGDYHAAP